MKLKHLELLKLENGNFIKINSLIGRLSLFLDHPLYKFKDAIDLNKNLYKTTGQLSLIKLSRKNLYILEDQGANGLKAQNFIYVAEQLSQTMKLSSLNHWFKDHLFDYLSRSIAISFLILYAVYYYTNMRYLNTMNTLNALRYVTGIFTLIFSVAFYYLRSKKTKSSFLKLIFKIEFIVFTISGTIENYEYLSKLGNPTDIF